MYDFYNYLALIKPDSLASLELLKEKLNKTYQDEKRTVSITRINEAININIDGYNFLISFQEGATVLEESIEMADRHTIDHEERTVDRNEVASCTRRFEIAGEDDYDMDYFNDSLYIVECIESIGDVIIISQ